MLIHINALKIKNTTRKGVNGQMINNAKPSIAVSINVINAAISTMTLVKNPTIRDIKLSRAALIFSPIDLPATVVILFHGANRVLNSDDMEKSWIR
ncbi:MAG: hypothetical protein Q8P54_01830 [bacterium]|nr:hypothetical protein [bacterium]